MILVQQSVESFLQQINDTDKRHDALALVKLMQETTGEIPKMWGASIIGFGTYHYKYESGREGDTVVVGFAPRKQELVLYGVIFYNQNTELLEKLGKCKTGKGCLYIKHLSDINLDVLKVMVKKAYKQKHITS